jgi:hypothetical protein
VISMPEPPDLSELRWMPGVRIVHPDLGAGVIVMISRKLGALHKLTVKFDSGRRETLEVDGSGIAREKPGPYG